MLIVAQNCASLWDVHKELVNNIGDGIMSDGELLVLSVGIAGLFVILALFFPTVRACLADYLGDKDVVQQNHEEWKSERQAKWAFALAAQRILDIKILYPVEEVVATKLCSVDRSCSRNSFSYYNCAYGFSEPDKLLNPAIQANVIVFDGRAEVCFVWTLARGRNEDVLWIQGDSWRFEEIQKAVREWEANEQPVS